MSWISACAESRNSAPWAAVTEQGEQWGLAREAASRMEHVFLPKDLIEYEIN